MIRSSWKGYSENYTSAIEKENFAANRLYYAAKRLVAKRLCSETTILPDNSLTL